MSSINPITIKRINGDLRLFEKSNSENFDVVPNNNNILEIYFLLIGQKDSYWEGGHFIGKIIHSPEYPRKAPDYIMLTPNGRFDINRKICLTNSAFHQGDWAPAAWNLVSILEGFSSVWHSNFSEDQYGIGHLVPKKEICKKYTADSIAFNKTKYPEIYDKFKKVKKN